VPIPLLGTIDFPIDTVVGVAAGLAGPPIIKGMMTSAFPTQAAQYPTVFTAAGYAITLAGGYFIGGRKGLRDVAIGEVAGFLVTQIKPMAAALGITVARPGVAGYTGPTSRAQLNGYTGPVNSRQLTGRRVGMRMINDTARGTRFQSRFTKVG